MEGGVAVSGRVAVSGSGKSLVGKEMGGLAWFHLLSAAGLNSNRGKVNGLNLPL